MIRATWGHWLLEAGHNVGQSLPFCAWVSNPQRYVVGFGRGVTEEDAVVAALNDADKNYRGSTDASLALAAAYRKPVKRA